MTTLRDADGILLRRREISNTIPVAEDHADAPAHRHALHQIRGIAWAILDRGAIPVIGLDLTIVDKSHEGTELIELMLLLDTGAGRRNRVDNGGHFL